MIIIKIEEVISSGTIADFGSTYFFLNIGWNCMAMDFVSHSRKWGDSA
jgi:hypothetical protein